MGYRSVGERWSKQISKLRASKPSWAAAASSVEMTLVLTLAVVVLVAIRASEKYEVREKILEACRRWQRSGEDRKILESTRYYAGSPLELDPPKEDSDEVDIAYFIQVAENSIENLPRLVDRLHHPDNLYLIHFDKKVSDKEVAEALAQFDGADRWGNVHFLTREYVSYRGISMTTNTISAMIFCLQHSTKWRYFINISASDYPMLAPRLQRQLLAFKGEEPIFMSFMPSGRLQDFYRDRVNHLFIDPVLHFARYGRHLWCWDRRNGVDYNNPVSSNTDFIFEKAEAWMILPRDFVSYIAFGRHPRKLLGFFSNSASSPEHYFVTAAVNDDGFRKRIIADSFRAVLWWDELRKLSAGQHPFTLDEAPREMGPLYYYPVIRATSAFFARKFSKPDSPIMSTIDAACLGVASSDGRSADEGAADEYGSRVREKMQRLVQLWRLPNTLPPDEPLSGFSVESDLNS